MLDQSTFRVFISHKHSDGELASVVKEELERLLPGRIEGWVSGEDLVVGGDWNRAIKRRLADSHLLVLLYTRPPDRWEWCLYETGLFTRFDKADVTGVVCIYDPAGRPPDPITNLQAVKADAAAIGRSLRQLLRETWQVSDDWRLGPLVDEPDDAAIHAAALAIERAFLAAVNGASPRPTAGDDVYYPCHRVVLDFGEPNGQSWDRIPDDALVAEGFPNTSSYTLSLFGVAEGPRARTWGELVAALEEDVTAWRDDLDRAFRHALDERLFPPEQRTFKAWDPRADANREFRPMLYRVVRSGPDRVPVGVTIMLEPVG